MMTQTTIATAYAALRVRGRAGPRRVSWPTWKPPPSAATAPIVVIASDGMIISFIAWPSATRGRFWMYW